MLQVRRIAAARGVPTDRVEALVRSQTEPPQWGFLGRARINVLKLNLALDQALGAPAAPAAASR
jgi:K+-transporting ATPase ATPase C chain